MESLYSSPSRFQTHGSGERSCPDFENYIQKTENENAQLVRLLEEETLKTSALQKELDAQNKQREDHECTSSDLNEEAKELHKRFLQNKETIESLKKTNTLLCEHEEELQKKYEKSCSSLEQLKLQNNEVIQKYQSTWTRYHTKYESSEMATKLSGIKTAALQLQNEVKKTAETLAELKIQVTEAENEKNELEDALKQGDCSPKTAIINLAKVYTEMSKTVSLIKEGQKQTQIDDQMIEEEQSLQRDSDHDHQSSGQAMECEPEQSSRTEPFAQTSPNTGTLQTQESPSNQVKNNEQLVTISSQTRMGIGCVQMTNPTMQEAGHQTPLSVVSSPMPLNNVTMSRQPGSRSLTVNTNGLLGHSRIGTPVPASVLQAPSHLSVPRQLNGIGSVLQPSPRNILAGSTSSNAQEYPTCSDDNQTEEIQMNEDQNASPDSINAKSPGPASRPTTPKTPTSSQQGEIFNFADYKERMMQMSKSPGAGFSFHSRPMFEAIQEEGSSDSIADNQTPFFQPFFKPRQQERSDQFSTTPTFFNMSPQKDKQEMGQTGSQFHPRNDSSSTSLCSSLFSMSPGSTKESEQSTSVGFALFGDQPSPKPGSHGNQPSSPGFTFNFGASPSISDDRSTSQGSGGFNLF